MKPQDVCCETCVFSCQDINPKNGRAGTLRCHKHAPRPYLVSIRALYDYFVWPEVVASDWCSEYNSGDKE